ncbi:hypothetical protein GOP47_0017703 [Adiantum capillus-veneris]|uniref:Phosphatidic acid phosphatase type 2/haloperoxidase domain-containing protein n=1 Tax=Adiantum capillus-veneris TaxID=13818 RepID=A0A9D4UFY4_ADICA|nr:hypothetical protein GOP47_0017703 [Adiantum capillus-veneris]
MKAAAVLVPAWQVAVVSAVILWLLFTRSVLLATNLRTSLRPFIAHHVHSGVSFILRLQKMQRRSLDALFGLLAVLVSKEFYTFFLPLLFWSGHCALARQMTLLMAFSIYVGNCMKDTFSAPRPPSPPVRRFTATESEKDFALEYGLPSSHTINTICLSGYLLLYLINNLDTTEFYIALLVFLFATVTALTILGRLYLGMHSPIDVTAGVAIGVVLLIFWLCIDESLDAFIVGGSNVESFWTSISFLLLFAYPTPELPTPSFEFHTAFTGVALGVVLGVHRTYSLFHHENVAKLFALRSSQKLLKRLVIGFPLVLAAKVTSKELAKLMLPIFCSLLSIPEGVFGSKRLPLFAVATSYDIDTGIRLCQYAGLGWSVVELVPYLFDYLGL